MKNLEKYREEFIKESISSNYGSVGFNKTTNKPQSCNSLDCSDCMFFDYNGCDQLRDDWLNRDVLPSSDDLYWKDVPYYTPIYYWDHDEDDKRLGFYVGYVDRVLRVVYSLISQPLAYTPHAHGCLISDLNKEDN